MGVFDFVRNAGAKIGIGKSTEEREKEAADAAVQRGLEAQKKMAADAMAARKAQQASEDDAAKKRRADFQAKKQERIRAAAKRRFEEYKKSNELEKYIADLGLSEDCLLYTSPSPRD